MPLGLHFGGLGPILGGKNFNFRWMSFLNRFLLDFGPLWGAFWGVWTSSLVPKTAYFLGSRSGAGFSFSLWSLKGWTGLDWDPTYGPFHFHLSISRFLTERGPKTFIVFRAPLSKTLQFTSFGTPLAQKTFNLPGFEASWVLPAPSGPFLEPPVAFPGRPGGSEVLWGLLVLPGPS